ncbi:hypothetical protein KP509_21G053300 [Ceratopteris richardii]|uniref:Uncharacterized protein n=1 Tax=Ceratopteris richardii TaxID=49495 RepID=A0A8T2SBG4_CERRI|nr:hypothetical protein KP509_21G053300 [Ceratopteris richardii]
MGTLGRRLSPYDEDDDQHCICCCCQWSNGGMMCLRESTTSMIRMTTIADREMIKVAGPPMEMMNANTWKITGGSMMIEVRMVTAGHLAKKWIAGLLSMKTRSPTAAKSTAGPTTKTSPGPPVTMRSRLLMKESFSPMTKLSMKMTISTAAQMIYGSTMNSTSRVATKATSSCPFMAEMKHLKEFFPSR